MADISKITLPSGNTYDIKDAVARQQIAGGIGFVIVWTVTDYASSTAPDSAKLATIPDGITVHYNNGASSATGTLTASSDTVGNFYLIYSKTQVGSGDMYNEYVTVANGSSYFWEKIGDTQVDLSGVVTDVTIASTDSVIGSNATFTVTQPTITLASAAGPGDITYVESIPQVGLATLVSGGGTSWNSKDTVTAVTGVTDSTTKISATASITGKTGSAASSVTPSTENLDTTTIYGVTNSTTSVTGVQSSTTTASKATVGTSQTTADGTTTSHQGTSASPQATYNTYILGDVSVSNEILSIKGITLDTQTTPQYTFADVIVPIKDASATTVPIKASAATVATGTTSNAGTGDPVTVGVSVGDTITVVTAAPTITLSSGSTGDVTVMTGTTTSTDNVIGSDATFTNTQPTVTIMLSDEGDVAVSGDPTIKNLSATATNGNVAWNSKDTKTPIHSLTVTKGSSVGE